MTNNILNNKKESLDEKSCSRREFYNYKGEVCIRVDPYDICPICEVHLKNCNHLKIFPYGFCYVIVDELVGDEYGE